MIGADEITIDDRFGNTVFVTSKHYPDSLLKMRAKIIAAGFTVEGNTVVDGCRDEISRAIRTPLNIKPGSIGSGPCDYSDAIVAACHN